MRLERLFLFYVLLISISACAWPGFPAADPLDGTSWELIAYQEKNPIPGTTVTASFEDGQVRGTAGCNSYSGSYNTIGHQLKIEGIAWTLMACLEPEGIMDQEQQVMTLLSNAESFQVSEGQLKIFEADGGTLTFKLIE
jgi:heat shock protein HslJ